MPESLSPPLALRRAWVALLLVAILTLLAACSSDDSPAAVTVGSRSVSESTVDGELSTIAKNKVLRPQAVTNGKIKPAIAASWVNTLVETQVARAAVEASKKSPNKDDRDTALQWAQRYFGASTAFESLPKAFRSRLVDSYAFVQAYLRTHTDPPTEADLQRAYQESLARNCASRRYVSRIVTSDEAAARAAAQQLAAGADFATIASRTSTDSTSASRGGAMGCVEGLSADAALVAAGTSTPIGAVSSPFSTASGWQIVKVEDVGTVLAYDAVKPEIRTELQYGAAARKQLDAAIAKAKVKIAPRYGRWVVTQGQGRVELPKSATTSTTARPGEPSSSTSTTKP